MTTFDLYILRRLMHTYVILFVTFLGLYVVIDGFMNVDDFQEGTDKVTVVLTRMGRYYAYQSSMLFDLMGPTTAVASVMVVAGLIVKNSEYQPILAAGVPLVRITVPFVVGLLLTTLAVGINQEAVIPRIAHRLNGPRSELNAALHQVEPVHDYETEILLQGRSIDLETRTMKGAEFVLPAPKLVGELTTLAAESAHYVPRTSKNPAGWVLSGVTPKYADLPLRPRGLELVRPVKDSADVFVATDVGFDLVYNRSNATSRAGTPTLVRQIRNPALSRQTAHDQLMLLHRRFLQPLLNLAAGLACLPLIIRRESRSLVGNMALAATVQGLLFGGVHAATMLGKVHLVGADVAAWAPVVLTGTVAAWLSGYAQT